MTPDTREDVLVVRDLDITYTVDGREHAVARGVAFTVRSGEFVSLVGPSGVGKTSLVRCIAGLQKPSGGDVSLRGQRILGSPPEGLAFVSQDYSRSLLPWMRIGDNVALPLRSKGISAAEVARRTSEALESVGLGAAERKFPWQLSGGMQQRASIARALAYHPELLIMDEPFASVDAQTRAELEDLVVRLQRTTGVTVVLITHDIDTAVYMSDRVLVLGGRPASVTRELTVRLGPTRDQISTKSTPEFISDRTEVLLSVQEAQRLLAASENH